MRSMLSRAAFILLLVALSLSAGITQTPSYSQPASGRMRLHGHFPWEAIASSNWKGRISSNKNISVTIAMQLRNQQALQTLIDKLYNPSDPDYGKYLSTREFENNFAPTQADYDAVAGYIESMGLRVTGIHHNRMLLNVSGSAAAIEGAFNLHLLNYAGADGREFYAPDNDPEVPDFLATRIVGIVGLDNAAVWHSHSHRIAASESYATAPHQIGKGPGGGLTPSDILTAYNINSVTFDGSGQILALFELDGYNASDITAYENYYKLPPVPLKNVLVDGYSGRAGSGAGEVTLDIELQIAMAPGASSIMVYEGPNTNTGVIDTYNRIAADNKAKQISTSWGLSEKSSSSVVIQAENAIFQQMAAQGQSIYAASGDSGAYDNGATLSVDDPASQPYMVGVGGTQLFLNTDGTYNHETTWNVNNTINGGAGGGGISSLWTIPSWQKLITGGASTTMRNVPDVSLNADQNTGYSIYYQRSWWLYGGTSCAAPLWSAFTARVNQQRAAAIPSLSSLGFLNPTIYSLASSSNMHDINDSSTNLYYPATTGYDDATGLGSFNGSNLFNDLSSAPIVVPPPVSLAISSGPTTTSVGRTSATVKWTTNLASSTVVKYGTSPSYFSKTISNNALVTSHSAALSGLNRSTTYYFQVSSGANGSTVSSTGKFVTTQ